MISAAAWRAWCAACDEVCGAASGAVEEAVLSWCEANPGATAAEAREAAKGVMSRIMPSADGVASSLAAKFYDAQAATAGVELPQAVTCAVYKPEKADDVARYQVRQFAESHTAFAKACGEFAANDAALAINETVMSNVKRDGGKGVRFARVTAGGETCPFCLMLAGRGAVYHSRKSAGEFRHFHRSCRCKVVPGFASDPDAELVEGHRPADAREALRRFGEVEADRSLPDAEKQEVKRRLTTARAIQGGRQGTVLYPKPRTLLEPHERAGVDFLSIRGFDVETIPEDPKAPANLDVKINGAQWEMKNLTNAGSSVSNQVKRARIKWLKLKSDEPALCVFTNEGNQDGFSETCAALEKKRRSREVFMVLSDNGDLTILKDK